MTEDGVRQESALVVIEVEGANSGTAGTCSPADCLTDEDGEVWWTYAGVEAGDDVIKACIEEGEICAEVYKTWVDLQILLTPAEAENEVETEHTVTATIVEDGELIDGSPVSFDVISGPNEGVPGNCTGIDCQTDGNGSVSWTYQGGEDAGTDTMRGCRISG